MRLQSVVGRNYKKKRFLDSYFPILCKCVTFVPVMSKPVLHIFNPWHDMALAHHRSNYQPPVSALQMARDLWSLPKWIARPEDVVWDGVSPIPRNDYEVRPWGWDLLIRSQLQKRFPWLSLPSVEQIDEWRRLSSRELAVETLGRLVDKKKNLLIGESYLCTTVNQVRMLLTQHPNALLKQLWSSSGKGLKPVTDSFEMPLQNWCSKAIVQQGSVVFEPRYHRVLDFAMEFESDGCGLITFLGYSVFRTSETGQYAGNILDTSENLERIILRELQTDDVCILHGLQQRLCNLLSTSIGNSYSGPFGVDMMVVEGGLLHPCVEINLRYNMGQLAMELSKRVLAPGQTGLFQILTPTGPDSHYTVSVVTQTGSGAISLPLQSTPA